jgi:hypothetical protein
MSNSSRLQIYGSASNTISVVDNQFNFYMAPYNGGTFGLSYHPFRIVRYKYDEGGFSFEGPRSKYLKGDGSGNPPEVTQIIVQDISTDPNDRVDVNKWTAVLVGWTRTTANRSHMLDRAGAIIHCNPGETEWRVSFTISAPQNFYANIGIGGAFAPVVLQDPNHSASTNNSTGSKDQDWYFDVMFIRKGFYDDLRPNGTGTTGHGTGVWGSV